jgi:hypothetical protein
VIVQAGDTIARRYLLVRADDDHLPGLVRYLARDTRLDVDVTVDIVTSRAPSAVIRAAQQVRVLRDRRLSRVLAAGIERRGNDRIFYVVTERPRGVRLDELLGRIAFAPASAAAAIGEAAAALATVAGAGLHHGLVRAESITITDGGRVMLGGLGIDGVVAAQSGNVRVRNERTDAVALANLYLAAITGMDPAEVTDTDVPADVPQRARDLCHALIKGAGPTSLADVTAALGTGDSRVLRVLVAEAPSLWWPRSVVAPTPAPREDVEEAPASEGGAVESITVSGITVEGGVFDDLAAAALGDNDLVAAELMNAELVAAEAFGDDVIDGDVIEVVFERPRTRFGRAVDDLDEFHDIVAAQNVGTQQSVAEAVLERLTQRFPRSAPLANAATLAQRRAQASAPLNVGPLLLAVSLVGVFVAAVIGASLMTKPYVPNFDGHNNPAQTYAPYTFGPAIPPP